MSRITTADLADLLDRHPDAELLSVDCFDTLLWRRVQEPHDVFQCVEGITPTRRLLAEQEARKRNFANRGTHEARLNEIYEVAWEIPAFPAAAELQAEQDLCFVFKPVVDLILKALEREMKVSVTSDTYFSALELGSILATASLMFPWSSVQINTSADHGLSKRGGLVVKIAGAAGVSPGKVIHIGDNYEADCAAPKSQGVNAYHFDPIDPSFLARDKAAAVAAVIIDPTIRGGKKPLYNGWKAVPARSSFVPKFAEEAVGYALVGPVMYAFAREIVHRAFHIQPAFLMRDGFLPMRAYAEVPTRRPEPAQLEISRYVAIAASFHEEADVTRFIAAMQPGMQLEVALRQLGLVEPTGPVGKFAGDFPEFKKHVAERTGEVLERSRELRRRLNLYLKRTLDGKAFELIDLGYVGTVERQLARFFRENGWDVHSYYLVEQPVLDHPPQRWSLIGQGPDEDRMSGVLTKYIAPFEVWCSNGQGSVIGYTEEGEPVRAEDAVDPAQRESARRVQAAALQFVKDAVAAGYCPCEEECRQLVIGRLGMLGFMPTLDEIELMRRMRLDVNLGTDWSLPMLDIERAGQQLRRRGLMYLDSRQDRSMCIGPEVRVFGAEHALAWLDVLRFGAPLSNEAFGLRLSEIEVKVGMPPEIYRLTARATNDGFFAADFPNAKAGIKVEHVAFSLKPFAYVQIEALLIYPISAARTPDEPRFSTPVKGTLGNARYVAQGLIHVDNEFGTIGVDVPFGHAAKLVFRPIAPSSAG